MNKWWNLIIIVAVSSCVLTVDEYQLERCKL
jgi:hypothetical protein